jgi:hypothetical protein
VSLGAEKSGGRIQESANRHRGRVERIILKAGQLARISHHGSGRAGLQPRRYKAFLIIPVSRAPRSPAPAGLRGARDE